MNLKTLTLDINQIDCNTLLSDWRWLVDKSYTPFLLTAMGDMFLTAENGSIYMLNLIDGQFEIIADSEEDFKNKLQDVDIASEWLLPEIVQANKDMGIVLKKNQCYGMGIPAFLSGKLEPNNIKPTDVYVYYSVTGQLLYQVKDMPPGTRIDKIKIKAPLKKSILLRIWMKITKK
jgi:hypothetical protein